MTQDDSKLPRWHTLLFSTIGAVGILAIVSFFSYPMLRATLLSKAGTTDTVNDCYQFFVPSGGTGFWPELGTENRVNQDNIICGVKPIDCSTEWCDYPDERRNKALRLWLLDRGVTGMAFWEVCAETNRSDGVSHAKLGYHYRVCDSRKEKVKEIEIGAAVVDLFNREEEDGNFYIETQEHKTEVTIPIGKIKRFKAGTKNYVSPVISLDP